MGTAASVVAQVPTVAKAGTKLAGELAKVVVGRSEVEAERRDWRFKDPTWTGNPGYHRLMQGYLATCQALGEVAEEADLPDWRQRERARFVVTMLTSAMAPTNTLLGNPAALKEAFETGGGSLVAGARNFVSDLRHNGGLPSQVDRSQFVVGKDVAVTPGAVVFRNEVLEVLQYSPQTPTVHQIPVVVVPPQINKFYFMDLSPGRSLTEYAVRQGLQFFAISWRNPHKEQRDWDLDTYGHAIISALDAVQEITGSDQVHLFGLCAGGITAATVLNHLTAVGDDRVRSVSFGVTLLDWSVRAQAGMMMSRAAAQVGGLAVAAIRGDGRPVAGVGVHLDATQRPGVELLGQRLPDGQEAGAVRHPGLERGQDEPARRAARPVPEHVRQQRAGRAGRDDGARLTGGPVTGQGRRLHHRRHHRPPHPVAGLLPLRATARRRHDVRAGQHRPHPDTDLPTRQPQVAGTGSAPSPGPDADAWKAGAEERTGTWWEHWAEWIIPRSGEKKPAPTELGSDIHPVLGDAPGTYVHEQA